MLVHGARRSSPSNGEEKMAIQFLIVCGLIETNMSSEILSELELRGEMRKKRGKRAKGRGERMSNGRKLFRQFTQMSTL